MDAPAAASARGGAKIIFVGIVLILVAIVFVLFNTRPESGPVPRGLSIAADKTDRTYYDFETPVFRVAGAEPETPFTAELRHEGKLAASTGSGTLINARGEGLVRGDLVTDETSERYRGRWQVSARMANGESVALDYVITPGCSDNSEVVLSTDKKEYRMGEEVRFTLTGPRNSQVRWFGLSGRDSDTLNLDEANAYYGDITGPDGRWQSGGIRATITDPSAESAVVSPIVTVCDKTAQVRYTVRR